MDPSTIWQVAMDTLPLLALRVMALVVFGLCIALAGCVIGAMACHTFEVKRS